MAHLCFHSEFNTVFVSLTSDPSCCRPSAPQVGADSAPGCGHSVLSADPLMSFLGGKRGVPRGPAINIYAQWQRAWVLALYPDNTPLSWDLQTNYISWLSLSLSLPDLVSDLCVFLMSF